MSTRSLISNNSVPWKTIPVALLLLFALLVSGCEGDSQSSAPPSGTPKAPDHKASTTATTKVSEKANASSEKAANPDAAKTPENAAEKPAEKPKVVEAEKGFAKASDIIASGVDPFASKLPKIDLLIPDDEPPPLDDPDKLPDKTGKGSKDPKNGKNPNEFPKFLVDKTPPPPPPPPPDPLQDVSVSGIVFNPNRPMALISIASSPDSPAGGNKIVRKGDVITVSSGNVKILNITKNGVELMEMGKSSNKKTLTLPSMVGFQSNPGDAGRPKIASPPKSQEKIVQLPGAPQGPQLGPPEDPRDKPPPQLAPNIEKIIGLEEP